MCTHRQTRRVWGEQAANAPNVRDNEEPGELAPSESLGLTFVQMKDDWITRDLQPLWTIAQEGLNVYMLSMSTGQILFTSSHSLSVSQCTMESPAHSRYQRPSPVAAQVIPALL